MARKGGCDGLIPFISISHPLVIRSCAPGFVDYHGEEKSLPGSMGTGTLAPGLRYLESVSPRNRRYLAMRSKRRRRRHANLFSDVLPILKSLSYA